MRKDQLPFRKVAKRAELEGAVPVNAEGQHCDEESFRIYLPQPECLSGQRTCRALKMQEIWLSKCRRAPINNDSLTPSVSDYVFPVFLPRDFFLGFSVRHGTPLRNCIILSYYFGEKKIQKHYINFIHP